MSKNGKRSPSYDEWERLHAENDTLRKRVEELEGDKVVWKTLAEQRYGKWKRFHKALEEIKEYLDDSTLPIFSYSIVIHTIVTAVLREET